MSKFCTNCGKEILDDATVCPECNADLTPAQPEVQQAAAPAAEPTSFTVTLPSKDEAINKIKKHWKVGAIVAGVLVVAIIVGVLLSGGGYKGAVKDFMSVMCDGKASKIEKLAPEEFWEEEDIDVDDVVEGYEEYHEEFLENLEDEYGDDVKLSYDFKDSKKMDKDDLEDLAESISDNYDYIDEDDVTAAYEVELETTIKGDDDDDEDDMELIVAKIGGDWYVMSGNSFYAQYLALTAGAVDYSDYY